MDYLGLICLGAFIGAIASAGVKFMDDPERWRQALATIVATTLASAAVIFVDKFKEPGAIAAYPIGLLIGYMWSFTPESIANLNFGNQPSIWIRRAVGGAHLLAVFLFTVLAGYVVLKKAGFMQ